VEHRGTGTVTAGFIGWSLLRTLQPYVIRVSAAVKVADLLTAVLAILLDAVAHQFSGLNELQHPICLACHQCSLRVHICVPAGSASAMCCTEACAAAPCAERCGAHECEGEQVRSRVPLGAALLVCARHHTQSSSSCSCNYSNSARQLRCSWRMCPCWWFVPGGAGTCVSCYAAASAPSCVTVSP
jgi:hypothetical protein